MTNCTPRRSIGKLFFLVSIFPIFLSSGCATTLNQRIFNESKPQSIGLIVGHDISAVSSMTTGEEIFIALSFGLIGYAIAEGSAEEWSLDFENSINEMFMEKIKKVMEEKQYEIQFLGFKPKKWDLFENITDNKNVYPNLVNYYGIDEGTKEFDALLFVEYLLEGRLEGRIWNESNLDQLTVEHMKMKYAKSKIFLYDTKTKKRIYHDMVQKGYPSYSDTTVSEALDSLVSLDSIPTAYND